MRSLGAITLTATLLLSPWGQAQDVASRTEQTTKLKTTYSIDASQTAVTTVAVDAAAKYDTLLDGYMFSSLKSALQGMAYVSSVMQTKGTESVENFSWADYELQKKRSHAFLKLSLPTPVTLLFEIEESYRKCRPSSTTTASTSSSRGYTPAEAVRPSSNTGCSRQAEVTVKGPISVYGNYATSINVNSLMRNKQELFIAASQDYTGKNLEIVNRFSVNSINFDDSLAKFFKIFNIPVFLDHGGDVGHEAGLMGKVSPLTSRQRLMLGISRIARTTNERILKP